MELYIYIERKYIGKRYIQKRYIQKNIYIKKYKSEKNTRIYTKSIL